jgi:hypothetical protein
LHGWKYGDHYMPHDIAVPMRSPPLAACRRRWSATISRPRHQAFALRAGINRTYQDLATHYGFAVLADTDQKVA